MKRTSNYYLMRLNHTLIWLLVFLSIIFVVSGYGIVNPKFVGEMTGGILTRSLSLYLHTNLDVPILTLLMIHILIELKFALMRWGMKDGVLLNAFVVILGTFSTVLLLLMDGTIPW